MGARRWMGLVLGLAAACGAPPPEFTPRGESGRPLRVLDDRRHSTKQNPDDYRLGPDVYSYQGAYGFARAFDQLAGLGFERVATEDELTSARLAEADVLFVNLVSDDRPDFTPEEVDAIVAFVHAGGGLVAIADHTNVYRHAERINRFLQPMGVEAMFHTAADPDPAHQVSGWGWIFVKDFAEHPVARGLRGIGLQTGGPIRGPGVAFTSERSFGDLWDPNDHEGYYGNWRHDGDPVQEPFGPLSVVVAAEHGAGRIVVVGDQNTFGDAWIHFGSNLRLFLNAFAWAAGEADALADRLDAGTPVPYATRIAFDQSHTSFDAGETGGHGYYGLYVDALRSPDVEARATLDLSGDEEILLFLDPEEPFDDDELQAIRARLERGARVLVSFEPDQISYAARQLLVALAPSFDLYSGGRSALQGAPVLRRDGVAPLVEAAFDFAPRLLGSRADAPTLEQASTYVFEIESRFGSPLVFASLDGARIDIARRTRVGDGELVVWVQDGLLRNRSQGGYLDAPNDVNRDARALARSLLAYLRRPLD